MTCPVASGINKFDALGNLGVVMTYTSLLPTLNVVCVVGIILFPAPPRNLTMPSGYGRRNLPCSKCGRIFYVNNSFRAGVFRCPDCPLRCCVCGADIPRGNPRQGRTRRCARCSALKAREDRGLPRTQFIYAQSLAKNRGLEWRLTEIEYLTLRSLPCHYCGFTLPPTGMGIDRMDFTIGYAVGNVVPCCTECNLAKNSSFTYAEMLLLG